MAIKQEAIVFKSANINKAQPKIATRNTALSAKHRQLKGFGMTS